MFFLLDTNVVSDLHLASVTIKPVKSSAGPRPQPPAAPAQAGEPSPQKPTQGRYPLIFAAGGDSGSERKRACSIVRSRRSQASGGLSSSSRTARDSLSWSRLREVSASRNRHCAARHPSWIRARRVACSLAAAARSRSSAARIRSSTVSSAARAESCAARTASLAARAASFAARSRDPVAS